MTESIVQLRPDAADGPALVIKEGRMRVPLKSWAREVEVGALKQAENLAQLPFAIKHVALMADAHEGYGMPIGGVLFADNAVIPNAVGVDIGCGVCLIGLDMSGLVTPAGIAEFLEVIRQTIPVGNGPQAEHQSRQRETTWEPPSKWSIDTSLMSQLLDYGERQLGTLGGGNHFVELQLGEDDKVYVMLHSGSRSLGKKTCDHHVKVAKKMMRRWRIELSDPDLAWLPFDTDEARAYWNDMHVALAWAEENRRRMADAVMAAALVVFGVESKMVLDVHHNYATFENHFGVNGIVHRKGAVRAREGDVVLVPGSMGTASYVGEGLGNPDSFMSCQHGAGRTMSRGGARRAMATRDFEADLNGTILVTPTRASVADEMPIAYKSIEEVMAASTDLVRPTLRLRPLGVLKG